MAFSKFLDQEHLVEGEAPFSEEDPEIPAFYSKSPLLLSPMGQTHCHSPDSLCTTGKYLDLPGIRSLL